jgi:membrane protein DedA with SNARE-associated domain
MSAFLLHFVQHDGLIGILIAMIIESVCIPIPSELIMTYAGFEAAKGNLNFAAAVVVGVLGNLIGSLLAYLIGIKGGRPFLRKYGRYVLFSERHFAAAERFFGRYGAATVLIARLLPAIRTFISLPAGFARMPLGRFTLFTLIGCIPWVWILTYAGFQLGAHWETVTAHMGVASILFGIVLVALVAAYWLRNRRTA